MLDVLALSNSSMVERRLGLIRLNGDACSKRADPFISDRTSVRTGGAKRSSNMGSYIFRILNMPSYENKSKGGV